ncbi:hypothetical protein NG895_16155 [Aeoliella sp. ICT_H6.2]|uniref:DAGKc domain-containing protein n=1 Tax=Aeoliella straminimaris TaxID=2954799 RepID=A0A9X2FBF2_9BACT|nr:diacylglycerol kinase family protein [Aeoliella straminimaris]MCO6045444.1 hypothetical protein [Aeoliella straminimaris]
MNIESTADSTTDQPRMVRPLDQGARQVLMLVNRKAGAGRGQAIVGRAVETLANHGLSVQQVSEIDQLHDATLELMQAGELRGVVSAGGDGTICAALNSTPPGTPLAVLPLGTENLLARYLTHRRTPESVAELLTEGVVVPMDAATAGDQLFTTVLSAGLDAEVVRQVHENRRGNITHLAYVAPVLQTIAGYRYPKVRITSLDSTGEPFTATGCWSFMLNLPRYAMNLPIAPHAVGTDGLLDACVLERGSLGTGMWYVLNMLCRRHHALSSVHTARRSKFLIESADGQPVSYQIDGDPGGMLPVEVTSLPGRMSLVVSRKVARNLGFEVSAERD